jgi:two-component system, chemotaxis family, sensor kinase Cph1
MNETCTTPAIEACESEPIQAPGHIQSHGAWICLDPDGRIVARSATASDWLGPLPALNETLDTNHLTAAGRDAISAALLDLNHLSDSIEWQSGAGLWFDLVMHWSDGNLIVEWEHIADRHASLTHYAVLARRAIRQLQEREYASVDSLLQAATETIRTMTGCDRVMAYRFLGDHSGEVVAEAKGAELVPYLHQRYPAGDIPPQARRLYVLNPIRQISSVHAVPVPIEPPIDSKTGRPHDLSFSVLRSVSPIHIEYLKNMGVAASMSISIVIDGALWGMFACHHLSAHRVPHAVRLSCVLFTEVVTVLLQKIELRAKIATEQRIRTLSQQAAHALNQADDLVAGLVDAAHAIAAMIASDAVAVVVDNQALTLNATGIADRPALMAVADYMSSRGLDLVVTDALAVDLPDLPRPRTASGAAAGLLAVQMNGDARVTILWLRDELVHTINWAGPPDKVVANGPNGPRLTPRGSFDAWKQTVSGTSRAWSEADSFAARELKSVLQDVALQRLRDADHARMILLATLAHDLRDPLQSVDLSIELMRSGIASKEDMVRRLEGSTRRMQSLITYILDVSRIRAGMGLVLARRPVAIKKMLETTVEQLRLVYPGVVIVLACGEPGSANLDEDRFAQALANLVGNASKHGDMSMPIHIGARSNGDETTIDIRNRTLGRQTISFSRLVDPFKSGSLSNPNNKGGLGLGLYIANAIIKGHGATLDATFTDNEACFTIVI